MATRKTAKAPKVDMAAFDQAGARVLDNSISDELETSFREYAYSVITSRALPDVRDGFKPVHRRIIYGMYSGGYRPTSSHVKSARIVGEVMSKYHPHGDSAIYEAMVRLAQVWATNVPLVDGQGNFGSPSGAGAAAYRYTEARMTTEAMLMADSLDEDTVDFKVTYDGEGREPTVLPAAFPNLLVNGTTGIAVGMATAMIPHNIGEVVAAARYLVTHPNADLDKIMSFVPGPDLPTGGLLLGMDAVRTAYETGRGSVRMRARVEIAPVTDARGRGRQAITVVEMPYGVSTEKLMTDITDSMKEQTVDRGARRGQKIPAALAGIADLINLSDGQSGIRIEIQCKPGVNPQALLADLYRVTSMETTFGINNVVLVRGLPQTLGLLPLLHHFLAHRYEVVTRRTRFRRTKREERLHLVVGLLAALIDIDRVIAVIRNSDNAAAAKTALMDGFSLSDIQASYILDTPLRRLTKFDRLDLEGEQTRLLEEIAALTDILDNDEVLRKVVSDELGAVAKSIPSERRTTLIDGDLKEVLLASAPVAPLEVADDPCMVLLSSTGLVGRTAAATEETGEARARTGRLKHDTIRSMAPTTARGQVLFVTNLGRGFKVNVLGTHPLPTLPARAGTVSLSGMTAASDFVTLKVGERVVAVAPLGVPAQGSPGLALGTRLGTVKVCTPDWPVRSDDFEVISLKPGDEVVGAAWLPDTTAAMVFVSSDASLLRFDAGKVRPQGCKGAGMAGISLSTGAHVVFFGVVGQSVGLPGISGHSVLVTSTALSVKVTPFEVYPAKGRATGGVRAHRFLRGENALALAWVGANPAAATTLGEATGLPMEDVRRDGSGTPSDAPGVVGHMLTRGWA